MYRANTSEYARMLANANPTMQALEGASDGSTSMPGLIPAETSQFQHQGSMHTIQGGQSPAIVHQHRLSIHSNVSSTAQLRTSSMDGSDVMSLASAHGRSSFSAADSAGDDPLVNSRNDTIDLNAQDEGRWQGDARHDAPRPWTELRTKAGKERKRLPLACIACRRKKIRCSGEMPACKHCLRSRIPCVYKVTARKAAPRTDYMAMLDRRLKRMEDRVIRIIPKAERASMAGIQRAVVKPALPPPPPPAKVGKKRQAEQAFGHELDEWAESKGANAASGPQASSTQSDRSRVQDAEEHSLLQEGKDKLPPSALQEHLAEVFFDYVYGQTYHLLHKPSFMRKLAAGTVPPVLTLAVCAVSARFSTHPSVKSEPAFLRGEDWASAAREIALRRYDRPNTTILIVYLILGLHEFGTCQGGRSWMFGGMAQRMAYALQLHKDLDHNPKSQGQNEKTRLTFTDREIRRRTMWSCFLMDRLNSSGTDRPIFVNEQYIRTQLPIKEHYFQMEITGPTEDLDGKVPNPVEPDTGQLSSPKNNMGVAAYLIRLVSLWGKLIKYMNLGGKERDQHPMWSEQSIFSEIKRAAELWFEKLPSDLYYTPENLQNHAGEKIANQFIFLHIVYYQIILFMNRFALPSPGARPQDMPPDFLTHATKAALDSANQISALVHDAMDHQVVAPFAGYSAFFASTVHIYGAFSRDATLEASAKQNLACNVAYLAKMKRHWGMFHFVAEHLKDLYKRHADLARTGPHASADGTPAERGQEHIFQYGDWFDRYPHGVSRTDYEDPAAAIKTEPGADAALGLADDLQSVEDFFSKLSPPSQVRKMARKRRRGPPADRAQPAQPAPLTNAHAVLQYQHPPPDLFSYPPHLQPLPPGIALPSNPPFAPITPQHPGVFSALDRQIVLSSYADLDTSPSHLASDTLLDPAFDVQLAEPHTGWPDSGASSAWFMPFNMDPPTLGADSSGFASGCDWAFGGFGEGFAPAMMEGDVDPAQLLSLYGSGEGLDRML